MTPTCFPLTKCETYLTVLDPAVFITPRSPASTPPKPESKVLATLAPEAHSVIALALAYGLPCSDLLVACLPTCDDSLVTCGSPSSTPLVAYAYSGCDFAFTCGGFNSLLAASHDPFASILISSSGLFTSLLAPSGVTFVSCLEVAEGPSSSGHTVTCGSGCYCLLSVGVSSGFQFFPSLCAPCPGSPFRWFPCFPSPSTWFSPVSAWLLPLLWSVSPLLVLCPLVVLSLLLVCPEVLLLHCLLL